MNDHFTTNFNKIFSQLSPTGRNPSQPNLQRLPLQSELSKEIHSIFSELYKNEGPNFDPSELEKQLLRDCKED